MSSPLPTAELAAIKVQQAMGWKPIKMSRFTTGTSHYVFEAFSATGTSIVIRMGNSEQIEEMKHGAALIQKLQSLGVPIPEIYATGLDQPCPWVIMERIKGQDFGAVMDSLSEPQLQKIASSVADAQRATAQLGTGKKYGYAADAAAAPLDSWSQVLEENIARSRRRITTARLFDPNIIKSIADLVETYRSELDAIPATPFLHDTTTKNVIITEQGNFSGIVDVDDLCFGDPRYVMALTLAVIKAYGGPATYVPAWMGASHLADDTIFQLYVAIFLADLMAEHGLSFNGNERPSDPKVREAMMQTFTNIVDNIAG